MPSAEVSVLTTAHLYTILWTFRPHLERQMTRIDDQVSEPVEQTPISIFDSVVLAVRSSDGRLWLSVNDLAVAVNVVPHAQRRRVRANILLQRYAHDFRVTTTGGPQTQLFLQLEGVGLWVMTVNTATVNDAIRDRLIWLQQHLEQAVRRAFAQATGLPERSSDIEDIDDLGHVDAVLQGVVQQQGELRNTTDALSTLVSELAERVCALEAQRTTEAPIITKAQRGQLYDLVLQWATQLQTQNEGMTIGAARATCWATLKRRFKLAEYHHLPASRYAEAVSFVRAAYRDLGGGDLLAQTGLDLGNL